MNVEDNQRLSTDRAGAVPMIEVEDRRRLGELEAREMGGLAVRETLPANRQAERGMTRTRFMERVIAEMARTSSYAA